MQGFWNIGASRTCGEYLSTTFEDKIFNYLEELNKVSWLCPISPRS